jgi:sugar lactone lactonase YvrE
MKKTFIQLLIISITLYSCKTQNKLTNQTNISETKQNSPTIQSNTQIITYAGVKAIDDTYLNNPGSVVTIGDKLLITDTENNLIRQIQNQQISNYVGNGKEENINGRLTEASLSTPESIIKDSHNNLYVVTNLNQIIKIDPIGNVSKYAGKPTRGWIDGGVDGIKENATFKHICGLAIDKNDIIYVADQNKIRKIEKGNVVTIAGRDEAGDEIVDINKALFNQISDIAVNDKGEIFVTDQANRKIKKITPDGIVHNFIGNNKINWPTSIKINGLGQIIVFDSSRKKLYTYDESGKLINVFEDKKLNDESFYFKVKIHIDKDDNIIIPSKNFINIIGKNRQITQIGQKNGNCINGERLKATFYIPFDGVFDPQGNLFVIENGNNLIRKISNKGMVSVFSGNGKYGDRDGEKTVCEFSSRLNGITINKKGELYVLDGDFKDIKIKKIDSTGKTTTYFDPKKNKINWERPSDLVFDSKNNLFLSDNNNNKIYKIDATGQPTEYITSVQIELNRPQGICIDKADNLYICDKDNNRIVKISNNKEITVITPKNNLPLDEPENIAIDEKGIIYVTDKKRTRILKLGTDNQAEIFLEESRIGTNKDRNLSSYFNTLKIETYENSVFVFDRYNNQILELKE